MPHNRLLPVTLALLISGCVVGPDYQAPSRDSLGVDLPEHFHEGERSNARAYSDRAFWEGFQDPILADLIDRALEQNRTLEAGVARYERAAALLGAARSERWPQLNAQSNAAEQYPADVERFGVGADRIETYQVGAAATWELDLFGRLKRNTEARQAQLGETRADLQALQVAAVGELARSYFELRGLQQQRAVAQESIANLEQSLDIVRARRDAGEATLFDDLRAQTQLEATRALLPDIESGIHARLQRVAVLTGQAYGPLHAQLTNNAPLPTQLPNIPVGTPADVLLRRPDVRAAERRLAGATAEIGVSTAELFPRLSLRGFIGSVAGDTSELFNAGSESRSVSLGVDWTLLDVGGNRARVRASNAEARAALSDYEQTLLEALAETETLLVRYDRGQERTQSLNASTVAADRAAELARSRYELGYHSYFEVLDAERALIETREALVRSRTDEVLTMVGLYRALAGAPDVPQVTEATTQSR
ncbi:efflux transporter outer membrane subunit [Marinimicrobium agarilyticum]|uniref:efflux transporter outer membrane subunit n=1 Tax=Marinimicrobium agarilyticum TaxID=306546 RepID=UPI0004171DBB|nr:efflux transporter outer membrane subunit [Marinimicrobium agarilyticum]